MAPEFDYVAVMMEESRDLLKLTLDELSGSLQAHEIRVNRSSRKIIEKALCVKDESSVSYTKEKGNSNSSTSWSPTKGHGRGFFLGRGSGRWLRGQGGDFEANVQCFHCKKYGHMKAEGGVSGERQTVGEGSIIGGGGMICQQCLHG